LSTTFPRAALIVFSDYARKKLMAVNPNVSSVVLAVGHPVLYKHILGWILACCKEGKMLPFPNLRQPAFMRTWSAYSLTSALGITNLEASFAERLDAMVVDQVHYEDCRYIFTNAHADMLFLRPKVAKSIAMAYYEDRIRNRTEYSKLRSEVPEFCEAVRAILTPLTDARIKAWTLEEEKERQAALKKETIDELRIQQKNAEKPEALPDLCDWAAIEEKREIEEDWIVVNC
jgi:hypothetical protein